VSELERKSGPRGPDCFFAPFIAFAGGSLYCIDATRLEDKLNADELRSGLTNFYGTGSYATLGPLFRHTLLTDGVQFLVENANCMWLVTDAMAWVVQKTPGVNFDEWFVSLKLQPKPDGSALLTVSDGNYNELYRHEYQATTFPLPEGIEFWAEWGEGPQGECWIVLLPSEH
jgi:hypothetical protein